MGSFEAIVIYVACGSPFAVYRIAVADVVSTRVVAKSLVYLFAWPVTALRFVIWHLPRVTFRRKASIHDVRTSIEEIAFTSSSIVARLRFRDKFDEYVAFATATHSAGPVPILHVSNHPNILLAECVSRRKASLMIEKGLARSRSELFDMLRSSVISDDTVSELLLSLALMLADIPLRNSVLRVARTRSDQATASTPVPAEH